MRRIRVFGAVAIAVFLVIAIFTLQMTPKYSATASILLDPRKEQVTNVQAVLTGLPPDTTVVDTEVEVLKSRQLAERVVKDLKLDQDPYFNYSLKKPGPLRMVRNGLSSLFSGGTPDAARAQAAAAKAEKTHEQVVDAVSKGLGVNRAALTYVIGLNYTSDDPRKSASIANAFAQEYLTSQLEVKFNATKDANVWLSQKLEDLRGQVQQAEAAVEQYKIDNHLLSGSGATLTEEEISQYNKSVADARAQQAEQDAKLSTAQAQLAKGSNGDDVGAALDSPVIQQLRSQRAAASSKVADLTGRYGPRHPEMLKAQRELNDVDNEIQVEIKRVMSNLQAQAQVARQRTASVQGSLNGAQSTLAMNNRASVRLRELERNAEAVRTLYESFLNRFKETSSQVSSATSDARIVSTAQVPTRQSAPNVPLNLLMGLVLALGAGAFSVVALNMLDNSLATADDVERKLEINCLASIPLLSSIAKGVRESPLDYVISKPLSSFAEAFRSLRTAILQSAGGEPVQVVMITSSLPGEGKTTTTVVLGRVAAKAGGSVVIVDCDLRRCSVSKAMGIDAKHGLVEVLSGETPIEQALLHDADSGAWILPAVASSQTAADVFGSEAMDKLLADLRSRFDLVLLDTAPTMALTDTRTLAPKVDAVVFLAKWRKSSLKAVETSLRMIESAGGMIAGVVLTQVDMKEQARSGYGDASYYFGEYKEYYSN